MKVIVGDELGLLKAIDANKSIMESKYGEIKKNNAVLGLDNLFKDNKSTLSVLHEENFYLLDWNDKSIKYQQTINQKYTSQVVKKGTDTSLVCLSNQKNELELFQFDQNYEVLNYVNFNTENWNLFSIKNSYVENEIFLLNKKYPFQIYDINKNCITWKSKNVPNDELDLMVPIWDTDICQNKNNPNLIYTATAWGNVNLFIKKYLSIYLFRLEHMTER